MAAHKVRIASISPTRLVVTTVRQDAPHAEPQSLGSTQEIEPGEAIILTFYPGSALLICEAP